MSDLHQQILANSFQRLRIDTNGRAFNAVPMVEVSAKYDLIVKQWAAMSVEDKQLQKPAFDALAEAYTRIAYSRAIQPKPSYRECIRDSAAWELRKDIDAAQDGLRQNSWYINKELHAKVARDWAEGIVSEGEMTVVRPANLSTKLDELGATIAESRVGKATQSIWHAITHPRETIAAWKADRNLTAGLVPELRDEITEASLKGAAKGGGNLKKIAITAAVAATAGAGYAVYKSHSDKARKDPKQPWTQRLDAEQDAPATGRNA